MAPVVARACSTPTAAEADCSKAANAIPNSVPSTGLFNEVMMLMNAGFERRGETAPDMVDMPVMSTAKPSMIVPKWMRVSFFANIFSRMPMIATTAVIVADEKNEANPPEFGR